MNSDGFAGAVWPSLYSALRSGKLTPTQIILPGAVSGACRVTSSNARCAAPGRSDGASNTASSAPALAASLSPEKRPSKPSVRSVMRSPSSRPKRGVPSGLSLRVKVTRCGIKQVSRGQGATMGWAFRSASRGVVPVKTVPCSNQDRGAGAPHNVWRCGSFRSQWMGS